MHKVLGLAITDVVANRHVILERERFDASILLAVSRGAGAKTNGGVIADVLKHSESTLRILHRNENPHLQPAQADQLLDNLLAASVASSWASQLVGRLTYWNGHGLPNVLVVFPLGCADTWYRVYDPLDVADVQFNQTPLPRLTPWRISRRENAPMIRCAASVNTLPEAYRSLQKTTTIDFIRMRELASPDIRRALDSDLYTSWRPQLSLPTLLSIAALSLGIHDPYSLATKLRMVLYCHN